MNKQTYTAADIHRKKLLKKANGKPFRDKQTVSRVLARLGFVKKGAAENGMPTYALTDDEIKKANEKIKYVARAKRK